MGGASKSNADSQAETVVREGDLGDSKGLCKGVFYDGTKWEGKKDESSGEFVGCIEWKNGQRYTGGFLVHDCHRITAERADAFGDGFRNELEEGEPQTTKDTNSLVVSFATGNVYVIDNVDASDGVPGCVRDFGKAMMDLPDKGTCRFLHLDSYWPPYSNEVRMAIVVVRGDASLRSDDPLAQRLDKNLYWWYARVTIQGAPCPRLFRIPTGVCLGYCEAMQEAAVPEVSWSQLLEEYKPLLVKLPSESLKINLRQFRQLQHVKYADPCGTGRLERPDGSCVIGNWKVYQKGSSAFTVLDGGVEFEHLVVPGTGVVARGDAQYKYGVPKRNGLAYGTLKFEDGRTWKGEVDSNMIPNGHGTLSSSEGVYEGTLHLRRQSVSPWTVEGLEGSGTFCSTAWKNGTVGTKECYMYSGTFSMTENQSIPGRGLRDAVQGMGGLADLDVGSDVNPRGRGSLTVMLHSMLKYVYEGFVENGYRHGIGKELFYVRSHGANHWNQFCWRTSKFHWGVPDPEYEFNFYSIGYAYKNVHPQVRTLLTGDHFAARMAGIHFAEGMLRSEPTSYVGKMQGDGTRQWRCDHGVWCVFDGTPEKHEKEVYAGNWKDNKRHGQGYMTLYPPSPPLAMVHYSGEWAQNRQHGKGTYVADGTTYTGEFKNGAKDGVGTMVYDASLDVATAAAARASYDGEWKQNRYNGHGAMVYRDGTSYVGEWRDHKAHGKGKRTLARGAWWEGNYKNGRKHDAAGKLKKSNGDTLVGSWELGVMNGEFAETCATTGCVTKVRYCRNQRLKISKKRALRNAMEELDEHMTETSHSGYVRLAKRLKGVWDAINDPSAPVESDDEGNGTRRSAANATEDEEDEEDDSDSDGVGSDDDDAPEE